MPWDEYDSGSASGGYRAEDDRGDEAWFAPLDPDRLCEVASAVYYAIARNQALREGRPPSLPWLVSPKHLPTCPHKYTVHEVREAEAFLLRLGVIEPRREGGP